MKPISSLSFFVALFFLLGLQEANAQATLTQQGCKLIATSSLPGSSSGCTTIFGGNPGCPFDFTLNYNDGSGFTVVATETSCSSTVEFDNFGPGTYFVSVAAWVPMGTIILINGQRCTRLVRRFQNSTNLTVGQAFEWSSFPLGWGANASSYMAFRNSSSDGKVYYTSGGRLWNYYYSGGNWNNAPLSWSVSNVAGPISAMPGGSSEVFFRGTDSRMYVFNYSGGSWSSSSLKSSITNVSSGGQIQARPGKVYYRGTDGNIWNFYKPGGVWDAAPLGSGDNATGQLVVLNGGEVIFRRSDGRLYQYKWSSGSGWTRTQVSSYNSVSSTGLATTGNDIWFRNNSGGMMRATKTGSSWIVSFMGGSNNVAGDIAATPDSPTHVYYRGTDGRMWQFYELPSGGWSQVFLDYDYNNVKGPVVASPGKVFYRASNNDVWNVYWATCGGKRKPDAVPSVMNNVNDLKVYPNPASNMAYIQVELEKDATIDLAVYNMMGKRVLDLAQGEQLPAGVNELPLSVENLPQGVYLVHLVTGGEKYSQRLVIQ